jgi:hypothetical protein
VPAIAGTLIERLVAGKYSIGRTSTAGLTSAEGGVNGALHGLDATSGWRMDTEPKISARPVPTRAALLEMSVEELRGWWLEIRCGARCTTKLSFVPLIKIAATRGKRMRLREVLTRLRCQDCGGPPARIAIVDDLGAGDPGAQRNIVRAELAESD